MSDNQEAVPDSNPTAAVQDDDELDPSIPFPTVLNEPDPPPAPSG